MKKLLLLFAILIGIPVTGHCQCGVWRRDVKILADPGYTAILNSTPSGTTIDALNATIPARQLHINMTDGRIPRMQDEKKLVIIKAIIVKYKLESNDNDIHIVLKSPNSNQTLVAEIPDPNCADVSSHPTLKTKYSHVRQWFIDNVAQGHLTTSFKLPAGIKKVKVIGVPFWDADHAEGSHPDGAGPHFREIHPVVDMVPDEQLIAESDAAPAPMTVTASVTKTKARRRTVYSKWYPKSKYYYNPKTGFYYLRKSKQK